MRSTFYGIEIGRTGINVSQKGLDVTGHNISNVDTAGYTRQRLINTAYDPYSATMKFKNVEMGAVGGGAHVKILDQIRSSFLDRQYRTEQTQYTYWTTRTSGLTYVESLFEGDDAATLTQGIGNLFSAFNTLAGEGNDMQQRTVVQQTAITLCGSFKQIYDRLIDQQKNQNTAVETTINQVNEYAESIAQLNRAIYYYELDGQPANDLRDKRNLLLDQLSELVDIEYYEQDNKMVVQIDGKDLVNYTSVNALGTTTYTDTYSGNTYTTPTWTDPGTGLTANLTSKQLGGELSAHMDLRDNATSDTPGIPYFMEQLNTMAKALVETVNAVHRAGYTHPASGTPSQTGIDFFDPAGLTAGTISVSKEVLDSVYNIAASTEKIVLDGVNGEELQEGNQNNARNLYEIINKTDIPGVGGLETFMSSIVLDIAETLSQSKTRTSNHQTQLLSVDTQRTSVSGVSLDEEMTNLIKYQHAYSGSSRVITAMDEALETMINKMGRVGL